MGADFSPESQLAVLASSDDDELAFSIIEAGAHAFLLKSMSGAERLDALRRVMAEEVVLQRVMLSSFVNYRFERGPTGYLELHLSDSRGQAVTAPAFVNTAMLVDTNSSYLSARDQAVLRQLDLAESGAKTIRLGPKMYATTPGDGLASLGISRRNTEMAPRFDDVERKVFRAMAGMKGDLPGNMAYDVYYSYARTRLIDREPNNFSLSRWQDAMLSAGGAAPVLNPFGPGSLSPAALDAVTVATTSRTSNEQQVAAGNLTGRSPACRPGRWISTRVSNGGTTGS